MRSKIQYTFILSIVLLISCVSNDFNPDYQKELVYDGYNGAMDTVNIKTYNVILVDGTPQEGDLSAEVTKWYDLKGFHSMTKSIVYSKIGDRKTIEQITRDKHSLVVARNIVIESPNTEPAVTLARLKSRKKGNEEWLFRHYLDSKKYLEDATTVVYTSNERITKKRQTKGDTLSVVEIDVFNHDLKLINRQPIGNESNLSHKQMFYNIDGNLDSVIVNIYNQNSTDNKGTTQQVEKYKYEFDNQGNIQKNYTYRNDSLASISHYKYGYRD